MNGLTITIFEGKDVFEKFTHFYKDWISEGLGIQFVCELIKGRKGEGTKKSNN